MAKPTVFVGGPIWRSGLERGDVLRALYRKLEVEAERAGVSVAIPRKDEALALLGPAQFAAEIAGRIRSSDAMLALLLDPFGSADFTNVSIAWETQVAVEAHKRIAILTEQPGRVPRVLRALVDERQVYPLGDVDYQRLFRDLVLPEEEYMT